MPIGAADAETMQSDNISLDAASPKSSAVLGESSGMASAHQSAGGRTGMGRPGGSSGRWGSRSSGPATGGLSLDELRELAAVEVARLREATQQPALDRRDLLDDLASRLVVLLEPVADPDADPVRDLIGVLRGDSDLETRWSTAIRVLEQFATGKPEKKRLFWKS